MHQWENPIDDSLLILIPAGTFLAGGPGDDEGGIGPFPVQLPAYYMGLQPFAVDRMGDKIDEWCRDNNVQIEWCNSDFLHDASIDGRLDEFGQALQGRKVIFVGPKRLKKMAW